MSSDRSPGALQQLGLTAHAQGAMHDMSRQTAMSINACSVMFRLFVKVSSASAGTSIHSITAAVKTQDQAMIVAGLANGTSLVVYVALSNRSDQHCLPVFPNQSSAHAVFLLPCPQFCTQPLPLI